MTNICPNCQNIFEHAGKYCSERCGRVVRKQRLHISFASAAGLLALVFANYTLPIQKWHAKLCPSVSVSKLHQLVFADEQVSCCLDKSNGKHCMSEKVFGTVTDGNRSGAKGWIVCMFCQGTGKLREALNLKRSLNRT